MKIILIIIFIAIQINIADSFALSLEDCIKSAKENNFEVKSQEYSYKAAKSEKLKALGGFLPQISATINNGSSKTKIGSDQRFNNNIDSKTFSASQNLFNGFGSVNELKEANNILKKEKAIKDSKLQQISLNVIKAYLEVIKYKRLSIIGEDNLKSQKNLFNYIGKKFKAKDATKAEIAKAKADFIKAKNDHISHLNSLSLANASLSRHTGLDLPEIKNLKEVNIKNKEIEGIEDLFRSALKNNPEIKAAKYGYNAAKYNARESKSSIMPQVNLNFEVSEKKNSIYLNNQKERDTSIYLNVTVPIFNSGQNYFNISSTSNIKRKEQYNFEAVKKQIYNSIIEYSNKNQNLKTSYKSAKELEKANEVYLFTLKKEEKLGTKSIIELLEAKQNLYQSKIEVINLHYDIIYSKFELDALAGRLINNYK